MIYFVAYSPRHSLIFFLSCVFFILLTHAPHIVDVICFFHVNVYFMFIVKNCDNNVSKMLFTQCVWIFFYVWPWKHNIPNVSTFKWIRLKKIMNKIQIFLILQRNRKDQTNQIKIIYHLKLWYIVSNALQFHYITQFLCVNTNILDFEANTLASFQTRCVTSSDYHIKKL